MALTKIECPECGAGLKSPDGFTIGESVECPKCETSFTVRAEADAEDGGQPKKKKRKSDDSERSYKNSPLRYAVLGVLVVVMIVLGVMLVQKKLKDRETEAENARIQERNKENQFDPDAVPNGGPPPIQMGPGVNMPKGGFIPKKGGPGGAPPPPPPPPLPGQGPKGGDGPLAETPINGSSEFTALLAKHKAKLIGSWEGTAPDGVVHKVTYAADGKYTLDVGGKASSGQWAAAGLTGGKVLKITRGTVPLKVAFEGDELLHDTETPGVAIVMKKKA